MAHPRCSDSTCGADADSRRDGQEAVRTGYVDTAHKAFLAAVMAWNSKGKCATKHCATHAEQPLDLWCDACRVAVCEGCLSHGAHKAHAASAVSDVWRALQQDLQEQAGQLDAEIE
eukprot:Rhum_TRINITY_DN6665_c0_g1::Rhum_TRINITY_DN6665_c0_g1_i1::g.20688::m.20688